MNKGLKNRNKRLIGVMSLLLIIFIGIITSYGSKMDYRKNDLLLSLEIEKQKFEDKGEKVPDSLLRKIEMETLDDVNSKNRRERTNKEVENLELLRKNAIKDNKGKPIIPEEVPMKKTISPHSDTGYIGNEIHALSFLTSIELKQYEPLST